mgnify:CR=1 FL=1
MDDYPLRQQANSDRSSDSLVCCFCTRAFGSMSSLNYHQKTARYCLKKQEQGVAVPHLPVSGELKSDTQSDSKSHSFACEWCCKAFTRKFTLQRHEKTCEEKKLHIDNQIKHNLARVDLENKEWARKYGSLQSEIEKLTSDNSRLGNQLAEAKAALTKVQHELELMKMATSTSVVSNSTSSHSSKRSKARRSKARDGGNIDCYSSLGSCRGGDRKSKRDILLPFDLTLDFLAKEAEEKFTAQHFASGQEGVAKFVLPYLKHESGKVLYVCSDRKNLNFRYIDMKGDEEKQDPECTILARLAFQAIKAKANLIFVSQQESIEDEEESNKLAQIYSKIKAMKEQSTKAFASRLSKDLYVS